ncbi:MAG TPA: DUF2252 family protein [Steroidobacteraceae bacterium]|jgi:uncharacterized protein (DUF2252 family)
MSAIAVDLISPEARRAALSARQSLKMARSAHAYVRGNTLKFYQWLQQRGARGIPKGPAVWICGDCHLGNLGPVANADGQVEVQIRDLDQSVIGNPAHDLIRLALSLATAARGSDLPGLTTANMLEQMMAGYQQALSHRRSAAALGPKPESVRIVMKQAMNRTWKHLARERIEDVTPTIPLGERFWPLSKPEKKEIRQLFGEPAVRALVTSLRSRKSGAKIQVLDAAYWMKGCSSLGRLRYAVLLGIGKASKPQDFCLIDIKEAVAAAAPRFARSPMPRDHGQRVVQGARALSPYLGERMLPVKFMGRSAFIRELMPQDLKLEIDQLTRQEAVMAARYLAAVVGTAHARQMTSAARSRWRRTLNRNRSKRLDAPSWLWSSVVDLMVSHEAAYLEHCRRYALLLD